MDDVVALASAGALGRQEADAVLAALAVDAKTGDPVAAETLASLVYQLTYVRSAIAMGCGAPCNTSGVGGQRPVAGVSYGVPDDVFEAGNPIRGSSTVKTHVSRLLSKLEARDRAQLVIAGYEFGLVEVGNR